MSSRAEVNAGFARLAQFEADRNLPGLIAELSSDVRGRSASTVIRAQAARVLGELGDPKAAPHLAELAHDPEEDVRMFVFKGLGKLKAKEYLNVVLEGVEDSSDIVRAAAAEALGRMGDSVAIPKLWEMLEHDPKKWVRAYAAEALAVLGDKDVVARIPQVVKDLGWRVGGHPRWKRLKAFAETGGNLGSWTEPWG